MGQCTLWNDGETDKGRLNRREGGRVRGMEQWGLEFKHDQVDGRSPRTRRRRRRSGYEGYCLPPAPSHAGDRRAPPPDKAAAAAEMRQLNHAIRSSVLGISSWHPTSSSSSSSSCSNSVTLCSFVRSRNTQARGRRKRTLDHATHKRARA